jgi:type III pantothenate kinase
MMRQSLVGGTKGIRLKKETLSEVSLLARDTEGAVTGGTLYAVVAVIDRVVDDVTEALGVDLTCVITGGDAPALLPLLRRQYTHEPDLVIQGLSKIAVEEK